MSLLSSVWLPGDDPTVHSNTSLPRRRLLNCTPHPMHVDRGRQSQRGTHYSAGAESYFILRCTCYVFTPGTSPASTDPAYFRRTAFTLSTIISAEKHSVLSRGETNDSLPAALPEVMSVFDPPWAQLRCRTERVALLVLCNNMNSSMATSRRSSPKPMGSPSRLCYALMNPPRNAATVAGTVTFKIVVSSLLWHVGWCALLSRPLLRRIASEEV